MSCSLLWRPVGGGKHVGGAALRDALDAEVTLPARLDSSHASFLRGCRAANMEGADDLLDAINKHEEIEVYLEC